MQCMEVPICLPTAKVPSLHLGFNYKLNSVRIESDSACSDADRSRTVLWVGEGFEAKKLARLQGFG